METTAGGGILVVGGKETRKLCGWVIPFKNRKREGREGGVGEGRRKRCEEEEEEEEEDFRAPFVRTSSHVLCTKEVGQGWKGGGGGGEEEVEKRRFVMPGSRGQLIIS